VKRGFISAVAFLLVLSLPAWSQDVSKKKEIAVFNLSYSSWSISQDALARIDEEIQNVFVNMGRFDVIGMTYRLEDSDVNGFVASIKKYKEENVEIPQEVQMGKEFFTEADLNRLIGSFIVVIPSVLGYSEKWTDATRFTAAGYSVTIETSFTFVNVETLKTTAHFTIETTGFDARLEKAVMGAVGALPDKLVFEIRKVPEFQLKSGILEVHGSEVIIESGRNMGLAVGDEYQVVNSRALPSGKIITETAGLLVIRRVDEEISYATVLYADVPLGEGAQIKEVARRGVETELYGRVVVYDPNGALTGFPPSLIGVRGTLSRFVYDFRPFVEIESPINLWTTSAGAPLNILIGGEYALYLGRLQVMPMVSVGAGITAFASETEYVTLTHFGGTAGLGASWLLTDDIKIDIEAGYLLWISVDPLLYAGYSGVFAGGGVSLKF
jgi:hypothetical protein